MGQRVPWKFPDGSEGAGEVPPTGQRVRWKLLRQVSVQRKILRWVSACGGNASDALAGQEDVPPMV